jgi:hypothetical protein
MLSKTLAGVLLLKMGVIGNDSVDPAISTQTAYFTAIVTGGL